MPSLRYTPLLLLALAGCGKEPPAPVPPPTGSSVVADDSVRLQGSWAAVSVRDEEGKSEPAPKTWYVHFASGSYSIQLEDLESGSYNLVATASPKQVDFVNNNNETRKGLYSLDGDNLTLCFPVSKDAERPAEIKPLSEPSTFVITFIRTK